MQVNNQATIYRCTWFLIVFLFSLLQGSTAVASQRIDTELREALIKAISQADSFSDRFEAEVWLMDMSGRLERRVEDEEERLELLKTVHYEAKRADLPPEMVLAVIQTESNFNRWAISVAGAQGLMQIMPFWLKEIGREGDSLFSVQTNLRFGCTILRHYLDKENGDWTKALARYNGSYGRAKYPRKVFANLRKNWFRR
ncbi:MAG: lytic transglycosylase domain-containing protein [Gammaproteobacteria bacterium]